jgi:pimeloyl-ACP methyl ester carboxylesterase
MPAMIERIPGPNSHIYFSQQLRLHYVDWGNVDKPALLLIHGGRDHCRNWDWVAQAFRDDYHVVAPDLRGHGDSQWVLGAGYAMIDYVYDIVQLVNQQHLEPVTIIGHSLGGSISLQFAGVYPEKIAKVVAIEGLGPRRNEIAQMEKPAQDRMRRWVDQIHGFAGRLPRRYTSVEEAIRRMHEANAHLSEEQARHLTIHGTNQNEDGTYSWKFDNYVRSHSPYRFNSDEAHELWGNIHTPTLLLWGEESWSGDPEKDGRAAHFPNVRVQGIPDAGHWVHHDQLDRFLETVSGFLRD